MRILCIALALYATVACGQPVPAGQVDLFVSAGQSNAVGHGRAPELAPVPADSTAWWVEFDELGVPRLVPLTAETSGSSAWPAFAVTYHSETGRAAAVLQVAVGGTSNVAAADTEGSGHWSALTSGASPSGGENRLSSAIETARAAAAGIGGTIAGVVWIQGKRDADQIRSGAITAESYRAELRATTAVLSDSLPGQPVVYLVQIGRQVGRSPAGFADVQLAQGEGSQAGEFVLGCQHPPGFVELGWMADLIHWDQRGLNHVGDHVARVVAGEAAPVSAESSAETEARPSWVARPNPARPGALVGGLPPGAEIYDVLGRTVGRVGADGRALAPYVPGVYVVGSSLSRALLTVRG